MPKGKHHHEEHEEHVNHEAWVIPYADMLTLLMGLFLVLWAIGNQDLAKLKEFTQGFGEAVGISSGPLDGGQGILEGGGAATTTTTIAPPSPRQIAAGQEALAREEAAADAQQAASAQLSRAEAVIRTQAEAGGVGGAISFRREDRGLVVSIITDDVLFAPGSTQLQAEGSRALDAIAAALKELPNDVAIEGHTDNVPISTGQFPSNWELSTDRAGVVLRYLVDRHGLDPTRLVAGGYGEQRPLGSNDTPEGRALNRRVDVAVLSGAEGSEKP